MADETKKILLEVVLDTSNLKKTEADARASITKLQDKQADLRKSNLEGSRAYQLLTAEIKLHEKSIKASQDAIAISSKLNKQNTGSIIEQREELKSLKTEYLNLSKEERDNTERGKALQKAIADLTQQLKEEEGALGDTRRNVGNYKEALRELELQLQKMEPGTAKFNEAAKKAGELKDKIQDAKDATKAFATESKTQTAKTLFGQIAGDIKDLDFQGAADKAKTFSSVVKSITFAEVIGGVKNFGSAMIDLTKSLLFNPFVAIAAAVVGLIKVLSDLPASLDVGNKSLDETREKVEEINASTKDLSVTLRKLQIENEAVTGKISQDKAKQLQEEEDFKNEFIKLRKERNDELAAIDEKFNKEKEEDSFKGTKSLLEASGVELQVETKRRQAKLELNQAYDKKEKIQQEIFAQSLSISAAEAVNKVSEARQQALIKDAEERKKKNDEIIKEEQRKADELLAIQKQINFALYQGDLARIEDERKAEEERKKLEAEKLLAADDDRRKEEEIEQKKQDNINRIAEEAGQKAIDRAIKDGATLIEVTDAVNGAITSSMEDGVLNTEKFGKALAISLLKITEKIALTQIAASTAQSLAQPDSVATFGASGVIRAAILTALIKSAVGIASAQIQGFAGGGRPLSGKRIGPGDGQPIQRANGDNLLATVRTGEVILNDRQQSLLGGPNTFRSIGVPGFASGGAVMDGGFVSRNAIQGGNIEAQIVKALKTMPAPRVIVQDISQAQGDAIEVQDRATI